VGCRQRAPISELLRIVAAEHAGQWHAQPDPARSRPGRGAHLHPDPRCLELALRRRAFGRALRVSGVVDTGELAKAVTAVTDVTGVAAEAGTANGGGRDEPHPDQQGRTTDMSTR
jgi:hypothetical protein